MLTPSIHPDGCKNNFSEIDRSKDGQDGCSTPDLDRLGSQLRKKFQPTRGCSAAVTGGPARKTAQAVFFARAFQSGEIVKHP